MSHGKVTWGKPCCNEGDKVVHQNVADVAVTPNVSLNTDMLHNLARLSTPSRGGNDIELS